MICKGCGEQFKPHHGLQRYCSTKCQQRTATNRSYRHIAFTCEKCGKPEENFQYKGSRPRKLCNECGRIVKSKQLICYHINKDIELLKKIQRHTEKTNEPMPIERREYTRTLSLKEMALIEFVGAFEVRLTKLGKMMLEGENDGSKTNEKP